MHFVYKTIVKQFVDSEGRVIPVDLKIDNKIIVIGKIYALNSGILNFFFFFLRLLNSTLLHGVVTILTIVYSACVAVQYFLRSLPIPSHITMQILTRAYLRQKPKNQKLLQM